jgi:sugar (pentulose or hexulose) kinase
MRELISSARVRSKAFSKPSVPTIQSDSLKFDQNASGGYVLGRWTVVLDVGKTLAKLTLWDEAGSQVARRTRPNARVQADGYWALDATGIEAWLAEILTEFAKMGPIGSIVPVGHGAAAVVLRDGALACPPLDYESRLEGWDRAAYDRTRDAFAATGSPPLPGGLNVGAGVAWLETQIPDLLAPGAILLPWAQYWAWLLSGVAASEITSLGCHTDLWRPAERGPSHLAISLGWAGRLAPLRRADEVLGPILPEWVQRTGLPADVSVYCGIHDSNAALLAARGFPEIADHEAAILSTGTWFVAMRMPGSAFDLGILPENRDCLVNVDVNGIPIPSARFMGGREFELLGRLAEPDPNRSPDAGREAISAGAMVLPTLTPGVGPFPSARGSYLGPPDAATKHEAAQLYLALVTDASLDLIGARERIVIEGRFAEERLFVGALAALRPADTVYVSHAHNSVPYGALRLLDPDLKPPGSLVRVEPLPIDLSNYKSLWRSRAGTGGS